MKVAAQAVLVGPRHAVLGQPFDELVLPTVRHPDVSEGGHFSGRTAAAGFGASLSLGNLVAVGINPSLRAHHQTHVLPVRGAVDRARVAVPFVGGQVKVRARLGVQVVTVVSCAFCGRFPMVNGVAANTQIPSGHGLLACRSPFPRRAVLVSASTGSSLVALAATLGSRTRLGGRERGGDGVQPTRRSRRRG